MRWRLLGLFFFGVAVGVGWVFWIRPEAEVWLKNKLQTELTRIVGQDVRLDRVELHPLLFRVSAVDVRVGPPDSLVFSADRWTFYLTAAADPSPYTFLSLTLSRSEVVRPALRWHGRGGSHVSVSSPWLRRLPYHEIRWTGGTLEATVSPPPGPEPPTAKVDLLDTSGFVQINPAGIVGEVKGRWGESPFQVSLLIPVSFSGESLAEGRLDLSRVPLEVFQPWIPVGAGLWRGTADVRVKWSRVEWTKPLRPVDLLSRLDGSIRLEDSRWIPSRSRAEDTGVPFRGTVSFKDGRAEINDARVFEGLRLTGFLNPTEGHLNISWEGQDVDLQSLSASGVRTLRWFPRGKVEGSGTITGNWDHPSIEWKGSARGLTSGGVRWPDVEGFGAGTTGRGYSFSLSLLGGSLTAVGTPQSSSTSVTGINLGEWARLNGWSGMGGTLQGSWFLDRREAKSARGEIELDGLVWGSHSSTSPVRGSLEWDGQSLLVKGEKGTTVRLTRQENRGWRVDPFDINVADVRVWGRGEYGRAEEGLQLEGGISGIPLNFFPPLTKKYPQVQGSLSAEGRVLGSSFDPIFSGRVDAHDVRWRPGGRTHRGNADVQGGRRGWTLSRAEWDDALRADGTWLLSKGGRFQLDLEPTPVEDLFDFLSSTLPCQGRMFGRAAFSTSEKLGWTGWVRAGVADGAVGAVRVDEARAVAYVNGLHWNLESLDVRQGSHTFQARGQATRTKLSSGSPAWVWNAGGHGAWEMGPSVWITSTNARGTLAENQNDMDVTLLDLKVETNGVPVALGPGQGRWSWTRPGGHRMEVSMARGFSFQSARPRNDPVLAGSWKADRVRIDQVLVASTSERSKGFLSGAGTFAWGPSGSTAEGSVAVSEGEWKGRRTEGDATFRIGKSLECHRVSVTVEGLGRMEGDGRWDFGPEGTGTIHARFYGNDERDEAVAEWKSRFRLSGSTATVEEAEWTTAQGFWRVRPGSRLWAVSPGRWGLSFTGDVRNMSLGPLAFFGGADLDGQLDLRGPAFSGRLGAKELWVNQQRFEGPLAQFSVTPQAVDFLELPGADMFPKGRVRLDRWPQLFFENLTLWDRGRQKIALAGECGPGLWDFSLHGRELSAETLLYMADMEWPVRGAWDVRVRGRGSLEHPDVEGVVSGRAGEVGPVPYDEVSAQVHWKDNQVDLRRFRLARRRGYVVSGEGRLPVKGSGKGVELDLLLTDGKASFLKEMWPLCQKAKGSFDGRMRLSSDSGAASMSGELNVRDGALTLKTYAPKVEEVSGRLTFQNDRVRVERARARVGRGWVEMAGDIGLRGWGPVEYDLSLQSDGRRGVAVEVPELSVPPGPVLGRFSFLSEKLKGVSYGEPWVSLRLKGPHGRHVISGEVALNDTHFTYPPSGSQGLKSRTPRWWRTLWRQARWDVLLKTANDTWYRNEYVNIRLNGDLRLAGRPGDWTVQGRVDSREGAINYLGQEFQVNRGSFEIRTDTASHSVLGEPAVAAFLSGEAERMVTTFDSRGIATDDIVTLVVDRALLEDIQPRFVSHNNPGLSSDRVAMRTLGLSSDQPTTQADRDQLLKAGVVQLLGSSAAPLANRLAQNLGIGMISATYEPPEPDEKTPAGGPSDRASASSAKANPLVEYLRGAGAAARVRLSDRLSGIYKVKLDESKNQTYFRDQIELVFRLKGSLYMRGSSELDSSELLGQPPERRLSVENMWRFGGPRHRSKRPTENPGL